MNLAGLDPLGLTRAVLAVPGITVADYIRGQTPLFRLVVGAARSPDLFDRYPWLLEGAAAAAPGAWALTFSNQFVPMRAESRADAAGEPAVEWLGAAEPALKWQSRGLVGGTAAAPHLTEAGRRWADLLTFPD